MVTTRYKLGRIETTPSCLGTVRDMDSLLRGSLVVMVFAVAAPFTSASASTLNGQRPLGAITATERTLNACGVADAPEAGTCAASKKHASSGEPFKYRGFKKIWL